MHVYVYVCIRAMYVYIYMYIYIYMYGYMCAYICVHTCVYAHVCRHIQCSAHNAILVSTNFHFIQNFPRSPHRNKTKYSKGKDHLIQKIELAKQTIPMHTIASS